MVHMENGPIGKGTVLTDGVVASHVDAGAQYRELVFEASDVAPRVEPGQFIHLRIPRLSNCVLRRPFSVFRADARTVTILYKTVGRGTEALSQVTPGEVVSILGPLGRGFPRVLSRTLPVLVAGGYGVAPLVFLASRSATRGVVFIGAAGAADVLCVEEFEKLGWAVRVATEDGSLGETGRVTVALDAWLARERADIIPEFFACGPDGMLKAVSDRAIEGSWKAWLSLDKHMGCGMGACLACVQRVRAEDGSASWARVCREGPVFECREIVWNV
jgi:dihydroorotate dehydrogenase electron transfer subunit